MGFNINEFLILMRMRNHLPRLTNLHILISETIRGFRKIYNLIELWRCTKWSTTISIIDVLRVENYEVKVSCFVLLKYFK